MISVLIEVDVTVENIADDIHKILNKCDITNGTNVTDEISY
jgi:hypothetical protein